ncbi:MAG: cyclophilin-like fold protein [Blautia sp.]|nr:cyclophilin-like fold protein [Blautia sp.]
MQYYDIPSRYEIPAAPEEITSEKVGEVYYSEPNRIILFYHDAEVSAEYTPVGYFDATDEFIEAVENNPVLEGWGNKIISISDGD